MPIITTKDGIEIEICQHSADYSPNGPKWLGMSVGTSAPWVREKNKPWQMIEDQQSALTVRTILQGNNYYEAFIKLNLKPSIVLTLKHLRNKNK